MVIYISILLAYGIFEIVSNIYHLTKGSKTKIAESAKKQHGEIPPDLNMLQYYYKAILMLVIGALFASSSIVYFLYNTKTGLEFTIVNAVIQSLYGLVQAFIFYKYYRVWGAFLVYSLPFIVYLIIFL